MMRCGSGIACQGGHAKYGPKCKMAALIHELWACQCKHILELLWLSRRLLPIASLFHIINGLHFGIGFSFSSRPKFLLANFYKSGGLGCNQATLTIDTCNHDTQHSSNENLRWSVAEKFLEFSLTDGMPFKQVLNDHIEYLSLHSRMPPHSSRIIHHNEAKSQTHRKKTSLPRCDTAPSASSMSCATTESPHKQT